MTSMPPPDIGPSHGTPPAPGGATGRGGAASSGGPSKGEPAAPRHRKPGVLRLRAGLLLLVVFLILCGTGGHFVARHFGLGLGWSLLVAVAIWAGVGILLARMGPMIYFGTAALISAFFAYLVFDFVSSALDWSFEVSLALAAVAALFVAFTFYDFLKLKEELRRLIYGR